MFLVLYSLHELTLLKTSLQTRHRKQATLSPRSSLARRPALQTPWSTASTSPTSPRKSPRGKGRKGERVSPPRFLFACSFLSFSFHNVKVFPPHPHRTELRSAALGLSCAELNASSLARGCAVDSTTQARHPFQGFERHVPHDVRDSQVDAREVRGCHEGA